MRIVLSIFVTWLAAMATMLSIFLALPAGAFTPLEEDSLDELWEATKDWRRVPENFDRAADAGEPLNTAAISAAENAAKGMVRAIGSLQNDDVGVTPGSARSVYVQNAFTWINYSIDQFQDCIDEMANETQTDLVELRTRCSNAKAHLQNFNQTLTYLDYQPATSLGGDRQFNIHGNWPVSNDRLRKGMFDLGTCFADGIVALNVYGAFKFGFRTGRIYEAYSNALFAGWHGDFGPTRAQMEDLVDNFSPAGFVASLPDETLASFYAILAVTGDWDGSALHDAKYASANLRDCTPSSSSCPAISAAQNNATNVCERAWANGDEWNHHFLVVKFDPPPPTTRRCAAGDGFVNFIDRQAVLARYNANAGCCDPEFATCDPTDPPCLDACADVQ